MTLLSTRDLEVPRPGFLGGTSWKLKNLTPITVIFGKNGSGKSKLLRQIRDMNKKQNHYCVPERAGDIAFNVQYITQESEGEQRASRSNTNLGLEYRQSVIARIQSFLVKRGASRTPSSPEILEYIENIMRELLPDFEFHIESGMQPFSLKRHDGEKITSSEQLSSGETQLFTLGLDLLLICNMWELDQQTGTLLVDEPDPHLHPDLQQRFAKFLVELHKRYNCLIFISTHSTTLLSALGYHGGDATSVIYLDRKEVQSAIPFNVYLQKLSTCLGGHALMGPLFSFPILLVEGDDDYRIWSEIPRHHEIKISAIPCNGHEIYEYQKILENIFSSILDSRNPQPSGYALLDGDKTKPTTEQNHVKFIKLSCHESENLYLSDEILSSLGFNWDTACEKIIQKSNNYGNKSEALKAIQSWDRKTVDCKKYINEISNILDEKQLNWSYRLGKELGKQRPVGQLADFLGTEVIDAIWGTN